VFLLTRMEDNALYCYGGTKKLDVVYKVEILDCCLCVSSDFLSHSKRMEF